jgi:protein TonB
METGLSLHRNEKQNNLIGWAVSLGFHGLILLLLINAMAWKRQIPPPPEYGMEVNFGLDEQGFGEIQELNSGNPEQPKTENGNPAAGQNSESETEKIIRGDEEVASIAPKTTTESSPSGSASSEAGKSSSSTSPARESLFPSESAGSSSNGDKAGTTGDMGKKNGNPDVRGIYDGNPGKGSGGSSLDMAGWRWENKPIVRDDSNEEGKIVFEVKVDEDGNIISVKKLEGSVSPALVKKYQKEVESLSFTRTSGGNNGSGATGRITFIISSK